MNESKGKNCTYDLFYKCCSGAYWALDANYQSYMYKNIAESLLRRYAFVYIRFLGIQPSICISAGQPLYLFFLLSEWFIC